MPTWRLTRGTRDRVSADRPPVQSAGRYEDRVQLGPDGETVPRTCQIVDHGRLCSEPVWEGTACLPHYIRRGLYNSRILRQTNPKAWRDTREIQTYRKERDALVGFFRARLTAVRAGHIEPVTTFAEAYTVLDELWDACGLNRRLPVPDRIARFISFISRQDYIARHGWHHRDWVGPRENSPRFARRKEAVEPAQLEEALPIPTTDDLEF